MVRDALGGRGARALRGARRLLRLVRRHQRFLEPYAVRAISLAARSAGRTRLAARACRRMSALAEKTDTLVELQWSRIEYGRLFAGSGRWEKARDLWRGGRGGDPGGRSVGVWLLRPAARRAGGGPRWPIRSGRAS